MKNSVPYFYIKQLTYLASFLILIYVLTTMSSCASSNGAGAYGNPNNTNCAAYY